MVLSIPLELSGVFFGLWLAHQAFSSVSIMAVIIVLTGMDITTAILLLDQIMRRRREHPGTAARPGHRPRLPRPATARS